MWRCHAMQRKARREVARRDDRERQGHDFVALAPREVARRNDHERQGRDIIALACC